MDLFIRRTTFNLNIFKYIAINSDCKDNSKQKEGSLYRFNFTYIYWSIKLSIFLWKVFLLSET